VPTSRGWACTATGAALLAAGAVLRVTELIETGVTLLVLILIQQLHVLVRRPGYRVHRTVHPPNGIAGITSTVEVRIDRPRDGALPSAALTYVDPAPQALGGTRRFTVRLAAGRTEQTIRYTVTPSRRGRYVVPPGRLWETDPFGIVRGREVRGNASPLVVFPRVEPIAGRTPAGPRPEGGRTSSAASIAVGQEFFATREYRPGDDLRRIHWRSTARMGKVMVRQEELPRRDRVTIVLENRRTLYAPGWEGADAFERAVETAASLAYHFLALEFSVRLLSAASAPRRGADGVPQVRTAFGRGAAHHTLLMTVLATFRFEDEQASEPTSTAAGPDAGGGLVVLVGSSAEPGDARRWTQLAGARELPVSVVVAPGETVAAAWNRACAARWPVRHPAGTAGGAS
jgi:uncharacterized protein (DUF58 family)